MKSKILKLPVFLGIVVAVCGTLLALVYSITNPTIQKNAKEKAAQAYISMYSQYGVVAENIGDSIDVSDITGCSSKVEIVNGSVKGVCYTCSCGGFGGSIDFLVAFANGQYLGYTDLGNSETDGYGKTVIANLSSTIKGVEATEKILDNANYASLIAGKSVTGKAIGNVIENCRADYMAWYATK